MTEILVVDDHEMVRRGLKQLLTETLPGVSLGEASNALQASEQFQQQAWDLVLLDINLPDGSGLDLLTEFRQLRPEVPILVVSAYSEAEFAPTAFKLGAVGYLTKTSLADEVVAAISKVLSGGKYVSPELAENWASALRGASSQERHELLSNRELEVLRLLAIGRTIKEIGAAFSLSEKTIATYRSRIVTKVGLSTNVELARYALQHHLVE